MAQKTTLNEVQVPLIKGISKTLHLVNIIILASCFLCLFSVIEKAVDPCAAVKCFNGGTCKKLEGGKVMCACREGFRGDYCGK